MVYVSPLVQARDGMGRNWPTGLSVSIRLDVTAGLFADGSYLFLRRAYFSAYFFNKLADVILLLV